MKAESRWCEFLVSVRDDMLFLLRGDENKKQSLFFWLDGPASCCMFTRWGYRWCHPCFDSSSFTALSPPAYPIFLTHWFYDRELDLNLWEAFNGTSEVSLSPKSVEAKTIYSDKREEMAAIGREYLIGWKRDLPKPQLSKQHVKFLSVMSFYSSWQHHISMTSKPLANSDKRGNEDLLNQWINVSSLIVPFLTHSLAHYAILYFVLSLLKLLRRLLNRFPCCHSSTS